MITVKGIIVDLPVLAGYPVTKVGMAVAKYGIGCAYGYIVNIGTFIFVKISLTQVADRLFKVIALKAFQ
jgi:hypothetical protein